MSCAKYFLFIVNFICWVASVALLGFAVYVLQYMDEEQTKDMFIDNIRIIPIIFIISMGVIFVISFAGCFGAIKESQCLLIMYTVFLVIILGGQAYLAYIVLSSVLKEELSKKLGEWLNDAFKKETASGTFNNFNVLENLFNCCGTTSASVYSNPPLHAIPTYCCDSLAKGRCDPDDVTLSPGCIPTVQQLFNQYGSIAGYGSCGIIAFELLAVVAAIRMIITISKNKQEKMYV